MKEKKNPNNSSIYLEYRRINKSNIEMIHLIKEFPPGNLLSYFIGK